MHAVNRNLVIAAVGDCSQHPSWLAGGASRSFDVALVYFGDRPCNYHRDADFFVAQRGFKYPLIADVLDRFGDRLNRYDFIWTPDDDVVIDTSQVNRLFQIASDFQLPICQPAIARGEASYLALRQHPDVLLRYTRFVEVMCPLFSRDALQAVRRTFRETLSGWGIDWAWTRLVNARRIAVIDAVGIDHIRPLGAGEAYRRFFESGVAPTDECRRIMRKYGLRGPAVHFRRRQLKFGTLRCEAVDLAGEHVVVGPPWWRRFGKVA
jgi:hypothetical protein